MKTHKSENEGAVIRCNYSGQIRSTYRLPKTEDWTKVTCNRCLKGTKWHPSYTADTGGY